MRKSQTSPLTTESTSVHPKQSLRRMGARDDWMQNWDTCNHRRIHDKAWFGQMSLSRELSIKNGRLYQKPVRELEEMRRNQVSYQGTTVSGTAKREMLGMPFLFMAWQLTGMRVAALGLYGILDF